MATLEDYLALRPNRRPPRIIARSFWGFDPGWASLIGFTYEGNRTWFLENYDEGDFALIYGADGEHASADNIGRILGFIQIEKTPIDSITRLTPAAIQWEQERDLLNRWTHGLPVKRAWVCTPPLYELRHLAAYTFSTTEGRVRGSRGVQLTEAEAKEVLKLKCRPANVFMEPPVYDGLPPEPGPLYSFFSPSSAFPPSDPITIGDGPRKLYLSRFKGTPRLLLPHFPDDQLRGKTLVKVGLAKDADDRLKSLNQGFPKAASEVGFEWGAGLVSHRTYPNYKAAVADEDRLKQSFTAASDATALSVGGEFFLVHLAKAEEIFLRITMDREAIVSAPYAVRQR